MNRCLDRLSSFILTTDVFQDLTHYNRNAKKIPFMSIFDTEYYHNFKKLPEMNVYYIHFQTIC